MRFEQEIFDQPSGTSRGYATAHIQLGKKEHRLCHAYFLVGQPTEVTVNVPSKKMTPSELLDISKALAEFSERITNS